MTFQRYESRPITRLAHEISENDVISRLEANRYRIRMENGQFHDFVAHEAINTGDFVVYLNDEDIYHCRREVFIERNIVPGETDAEDAA